MRKELAALSVKPEAAIDFSDIPPTKEKDWRGAAATLRRRLSHSAVGADLQYESGRAHCFAQQPPGSSRFALMKLEILSLLQGHLDGNMYPLEGQHARNHPAKNTSSPPGGFEVDFLAVEPAVIACYSGSLQI
jgi:hypothetical protein